MLGTPRRGGAGSAHLGPATTSSCRNQPLGQAGDGESGAGGWGDEEEEKKSAKQQQDMGRCKAGGAEPHDFPLLGRLGASEIPSW